MASLQARHSRSCPRWPWSPFEADGCTCAPMYHTVHRHDGKRISTPVGKNKREAKRALEALRGDVARRTYRVVEDVRFDAWGAQWLAGFTGKENTKRLYRKTIAYAGQVFGARKVRDLTPADVRRFLDKIRDTNHRPATDEQPGRDASPATLDKHLRALGACLEAAVREGFATENPVRRLHRSARPQIGKKRPSYFDDAELARLWPELAHRPWALAMSKLAATTGLRVGELSALRWSDVNLSQRELTVARSFTPGIGETPPKDGEPRTVDLVPAAWSILAEWYTESGGDDGLVFEREDRPGNIDAGYMLDVLYAAMERAGIPRVGEGGRARTFHSFRHTFARISLEHGAAIDWLRRQLGHSSITLTVDRYGAWSRSAEKAEADKLAAAFPV
jgi:integrase